MVAGLAAVLLTACLLFLNRIASPRFPPPLTVHLSGSKTPLQVHPSGMGILLVLPDGSLWRWGDSGAWALPAAIVPERIETNCDWVQTAGFGLHTVGLRSSGTLWQWKQPGVNPGNQPQQVEEGNDWIAVSAGSMHAVALRRDGTLWAWGDNAMGQLGIGPGLSPTNLVQVGTNHDWTAVNCEAVSTLALRADGTLWAWGQFNSFRGGLGGFAALPTPTRVCEDTNWAGLVPGWWPLAWTRNGDLWEPLYGRPNPDAPAVAVGRLLTTNAAPGRVATAYCGLPKIYEIRADGTLWERNCAMGPWSNAPTDKWRRVGKRSDWVSLWGSGSLALGLTRDGTLWTWGIDPTGRSSAGFFAKLKVVQAQVRTWLARPTGRFGVGTMPGYQKEPRPLLRLISE